MRSGLLPGALLVSEDGGTVTDTRGEPWSPAGKDLLASAPGLHVRAVDVLSDLGRPAPPGPGPPRAGPG
ncbi:hypothetical protein ACWZEH_14560 [Streptomyces sp. QTS137]